ncbi:MAG: HAD family hydrolase, partial [Bryobacteraceae bacterium]
MALSEPFSQCGFGASLALACDYDGTLAHRGIVSAATVRALERFRDSGRRLFLVTGRLLPELDQIFPRLDLFDCVVAENGPVLFDPRTREKTILSRRRSERLIAELRKRGVEEITAGEVVVATSREHASEAIDAIRGAGLDLRLIYNKDSLMMLPPGMDKMTGLAAALGGFHILSERTIAVGDGENDEPLLAGCGCAVAVANAVIELK